MFRGSVPFVIGDTEAFCSGFAHIIESRRGATVEVRAHRPGRPGVPSVHRVRGPLRKAAGGRIMGSQASDPPAGALMVSQPGPEKAGRSVPVVVSARDLVAGPAGLACVALLADAFTVAAVNRDGRVGETFPAVVRARKGQPVVLHAGPEDAIELRSARSGRVLLVPLVRQPWLLPSGWQSNSALEVSDQRDAALRA